MINQDTESVIADLITQGYSQRAIAQMLSIHRKTVAKRLTPQVQTQVLQLPPGTFLITIEAWRQLTTTLDTLLTSVEELKAEITALKKEKQSGNKECTTDVPEQECTTGTFPKSVPPLLQKSIPVERKKDTNSVPDEPISPLTRTPVYAHVPTPDDCQLQLPSSFIINKNDSKCECNTEGNTSIPHVREDARTHTYESVPAPVPTPAYTHAREDYTTALPAQAQAQVTLPASVPTPLPAVSAQGTVPPPPSVPAPTQATQVEDYIFTPCQAHEIASAREKETLTSLAQILTTPLSPDRRAQLLAGFCGQPEHWKGMRKAAAYPLAELERALLHTCELETREKAKNVDITFAAKLYNTLKFPALIGKNRQVWEKDDAAAARKKREEERAREMDKLSMAEIREIRYNSIEWTPRWERDAKQKLEAIRAARAAQAVQEQRETEQNRLAIPIVSDRTEEDVQEEREELARQQEEYDRSIDDDLIAIGA